jgi:hypothetical protein
VLWWLFPLLGRVALGSGGLFMDLWTIESKVRLEFRFIISSKFELW